MASLSHVSTLQQARGVRFSLCRGLRTCSLTVWVLLHSLDVCDGGHGIARTEWIDEVSVEQLLVKRLARVQKTTDRVSQP